MNDICTQLGIKKRRSSAYYSQGNGFAERNIRTVKDTLRSVLLHRRIPQTQWRQIQHQLVFALNTTTSKATNCMPYNVIFGRSATLPQDVVFQEGHHARFDPTSPSDYQKVLCVTINDIYSHVIENLELSKVKMQQHYNRNIRVIHYKEGQKVWLKTKHYKTGENRKLAPRRNGPWTIREQLPNGVNFRIEN